MKLEELFAHHEQLLLEGKIELIVKKQQKAILKAFSKEPHNIVMEFEDDVYRIVNEFKNTHKKYIQWITNRYIKGEFLLEDLNKLKTNLEQFDKIKNKLQPNEKDINRYKTLESFYTVIMTVL